MDRFNHYLISLNFLMYLLLLILIGQSTSRYIADIDDSSVNTKQLAQAVNLVDSSNNNNYVNLDNSVESEHTGNTDSDGNVEKVKQLQRCGETGQSIQKPLEDYYCPRQPEWLPQELLIKTADPPNPNTRWIDGDLVIEKCNATNEYNCLKVEFASQIGIANVHGWSICGGNSGKNEGRIIQYIMLYRSPKADQWSTFQENGCTSPKVFKIDECKKGATSHMLDKEVIAQEMMTCPLQATGCQPLLHLKVKGCLLKHQKRAESSNDDEQDAGPECEDEEKWLNKEGQLEECMFHTNAGGKAADAIYSHAGYTFPNLPVKIKENKKYYLEVNFKRKQIVKALKIMGGTVGKVQGTMEHFKLSYQDADDNNSWKFAAQTFGKQQSHSYTSGYYKALRIAVPCIVTSGIRIYPQSWCGDRPVLKLDIKACDLKMCKSDDETEDEAIQLAGEAMESNNSLQPSLRDYEVIMKHFDESPFKTDVRNVKKRRSGDALKQDIQAGSTAYVSKENLINKPINSMQDPDKVKRMCEQQINLLVDNAKQETENEEMEVQSDTAPVQEQHSVNSSPKTNNNQGILKNAEKESYNEHQIQLNQKVQGSFGTLGSEISKDDQRQLDETLANKGETQEKESLVFLDMYGNSPVQNSVNEWCGNDKPSQSCNKLLKEDAEVDRSQSKADSNNPAEKLSREYSETQDNIQDKNHLEGTMESMMEQHVDKIDSECLSDSQDLSLLQLSRNEQNMENIHSDINDEDVKQINESPIESSEVIINNNNNNIQLAQNGYEPLADTGSSETDMGKNEFATRKEVDVPQMTFTQDVNDELLLEGTAKDEVKQKTNEIELLENSKTKIYNTVNEEDDKFENNDEHNTLILDSKTDTKSQDEDQFDQSNSKQEITVEGNTPDTIHFDQLDKEYFLEHENIVKRDTNSIMTLTGDRLVESNGYGQNQGVQMKKQVIQKPGSSFDVRQLDQLANAPVETEDILNHRSINSITVNNQKLQDGNALEHYIPNGRDSVGDHDVMVIPMKYARATDIKNLISQIKEAIIRTKDEGNL